ncbi:CPBP family intramembrane glutamic endopeptidase [Nocardia mikamii]|uniref:CPBP family intramembrane glutamic endopeptidase n=1 Tax=Nocardia mikamii TaxID=508464 RepID=UPI00350E4AC2
MIWALWHAPLTLLGYGFTDIGAWSAVAYIPFCICFGAFLGRLRLRSQSVWPAAVAHASWTPARWSSPRSSRAPHGTSRTRC